MGLFQRRSRHQIAPQEGTVVDAASSQRPQPDAFTQAIDADTQAVLEMVANKQHAKHPHSKDGEDFSSSASHQPMEAQDEAVSQLYEDDNDDGSLFKFSPPQPGQDYSGSAAPSNFNTVDSSPPLSSGKPSVSTLSPVKSSPSHSLSRSDSGKRRQPYVYPGSPIYTTGHELRGDRQGTPVIELADHVRGASFSVGSPPEYSSQDKIKLSRSLTSYSAHRNDGHEYWDIDTKRRSSTSSSGRSGGTVKTTKRKGGDGQNLRSDEFAMYDLAAYRGGDPVNIPATAYSSRGIPATANTLEGMDGRIEQDKVSLSAFGIDEEDSPYPEVRASVSNIDDPEMPCLTFRAWFLGLIFCSIGGCGNFFFNIRYPSPLITPITIQVISYPCGKFLAYILPMRIWRVPSWLTKLGFPEECSLNPGPVNIKEHTVIVIMANSALSPAYATNITLVLDKFYNVPKGIGFDFLLVLSSQIIGFSFAGLCRRFLIWPASLVWPQNLVTCTLFNTFHAEEDDGSDGSVTRFRFFTYVLGGAFFWYIFPGESLCVSINVDHLC